MPIGGHDPLFGRGMNAAATIFRHFYVRREPDRRSWACGLGDQRGPGNNCPHPHPHPGVLIEDIADPANPHVVGEIGPPLEGNPGYHLPRAAGVAAGRAADRDELPGQLGDPRLRARH